MKSLEWKEQKQRGVFEKKQVVLKNNNNQRYKKITQQNSNSGVKKSGKMLQQKQKIWRRLHLKNIYINTFHNKKENLEEIMEVEKRKLNSNW